MKKALFLPILIFILFRQAAFMATNFARAQTTNTIVCRGGGEMYSTYRQGNNFNQLIINFTKAKTSYRQKPPSSGECSWVKRAISAEEPSQLVWEPKKFNDDTSYLLESVSSNNLFYIHTCNVNNKYFIIEKIAQ